VAGEGKALRPAFPCSCADPMFSTLDHPPALSDRWALVTGKEKNSDTPFQYFGQWPNCSFTANTCDGKEARTLFNSSSVYHIQSEMKRLDLQVRSSCRVPSSLRSSYSVPFDRGPLTEKYARTPYDSPKWTPAQVPYAGRVCRDRPSKARDRPMLPPRLGRCSPIATFRSTHNFVDKSVIVHIVIAQETRASCKRNP